jgi:hypothetical protein
MCTAAIFGMKTIFPIQVDYNSQVRPFRHSPLTWITHELLTLSGAVAIALGISLATMLGWLFFIARS